MKRIILCADGTWQRPRRNGRPTNVVTLSRAIRPLDTAGPTPIPQVVFYDAGVGSGNLMDKLLGGAFGSGLDTNVKDLYRSLAQNYVKGDEIYLFGFSRGAYTARSTAGMIRNCGVLRKERLHLIETEAYDLYRSHTHHPRSDVARAFRAANAVEARIRFLGVWDTVGALGVPLPRLRQLLLGVVPGFHRWDREHFQFHDMQLSSRVDAAFHALAIDEHRPSFRAALWDDDGRAEVEQTWFPGDHSGIGGSHPDSGLSDIALWAMVQHLEGTGLALDHDYLTRITRPHYSGTLYPSPSGFHRLLGRTLRPIDGRAQRIDASARRRFAHRFCKYRPRNLARALAQESTRP